MIVEVKQGKLRGTKKISVLSGKEYCCFLGIPFAKPPTGDLRFRPPQPVEKWEGILEATEDGPLCIQMGSGQRKIIGSEDCLYLNVFTPMPPSEIKKPKTVMVFIHGGGFTNGSGTTKSHSPDFLINYDIVYVSFNYRLHALGFLNLNVSSCTGNCGLKDQLLALKWVKKNIAKFGGDSENITLFGESAGATSVSWHMLSPRSKGLFHRAILQSGMALSTWNFLEDPLERGQRLGRKLGFRGTDPEKLVEFLKIQSAESIYDASLQIQEDLKKEFPGSSVSLPFFPSMEIITEDVFISDRPEILFKTADPLPLIAGINDKEGMILYGFNTENLSQVLRGDFTHVLRDNIPCHSSQIKQLSKMVKEFYFKNEDITEEKLIDMYTDINYYRFYEAFEYITNSEFPVYVYEFSFHGKFNFFSEAFNKNIKKGASHADDLPYLFLSNRMKTDLIEDPERTVINNMCTLWTNFAKTGNPTHNIPDIDWKPNSVSDKWYLKIDKDLKLVKGELLKERFDFWKNIYKMSVTESKY